MKRRCVIAHARIAATLVALPLLLGFVSTPALAQQRDAAPSVMSGRYVSPAEVKMATYDFIRTLEAALGRDSSASDGIFWMDPEVFKSVTNKEKFVEAVTVFKLHCDAAMSRPGEPSRAASPLAGSAVFVPNYPPYSPITLALHTLTFIDVPSDRCGGVAYVAYRAGLFGVGEVFFVARQVQQVLTCDPVGVVCAVATGVMGGLEVAYRLASYPAQLADLHDSEVDAAELEAGYRNAALVVGDLASHDDRVMSKLNGQAAAVTGMAAALAAHDAKLELHDQDMKARLSAALATLVANQAEIIKLLKTPEGRRPGWGKEGY